MSIGWQEQTASLGGELRAGDTHNLPLLVAVVIPTYNRAELLKRCLHALQQQTLPANAFEAVVVDDGSTDPTLEFLRTFQPAYHLQFFSQQHAGPACARNKGIAASTAPLILFLDDDVIPASDMLAQHVGFHLRQPADELAGLGHVDWAQDIEITAFMQYITGEGAHLFEWDTISRRRTMLSQWHFYTCNVSLKRAILHDERFDEHFPYPAFEDHELAYRLQRKHRLQVDYWPTARGWHYDVKNFNGFLLRQFQAGLSATYFAHIHPEVTQKLIEPYVKLGPVDMNHIRLIETAAVELEKVNLQRLENIQIADEVPGTSPSLGHIVRKYLFRLYDMGLGMAYRLGVLEGLARQKQ